MNRKTIWIVLALFILPFVVRVLWFFPGFYLPHSVATPDYSNLKMQEAPVSTPQPEELTQKTGSVVLLDFSHSNQFQPDEIQALLDDLTKRGARVELNSDSTKLENQLKYASAYIVISPSADFTLDEIRLVQNFVSGGGRLVVFTDATRGLVSYDSTGNPVNAPDVNIANPLLEPYDISINNDYLYNLTMNEGNFRNVYFGFFGKSDLTWGLKQVVLYGAHSLQTDSGFPMLIGDDKTLSSQTDATPGNDPKKGWAGAVLSKDGNVLAFGDFTFLTTPYDTVADNSTLINNIADYLLNGQRKITLANFPYLFNPGLVHVLPTSNVQMTAELTGALSRLQSELKSVGVGMDIAKDSSVGGQMIVLGTFSPSDDLNKYTDGFNITLSETSEYVEISSFGKIGRSGNGVLMFTPGANTLVLLADSVDDLTTLMDTLSSGDLSGCVLQDEVGVCSIGFGGSFSEGSPTPLFPSGSETPTPAPGG